MKAEYDVEVEWRAFELHPEIPPEGMPLSAYIHTRFDAMSRRLKQMAGEVGLDMVTIEIIPNSRRALEAAEYARQQDQHEVFHQSVFCLLFAEGQDISRWEVLRAAAEEAGLDPEAMQQATETGQYQVAVNAQINEARALGITGVPTYIFNDRYAIVGAQPYEAFREVMARLMADVEHEL